MKVNLGCGRDYLVGWLNVDCDKDVKADIYLDINKQPLPTRHEYIYVDNVLEHLNDDAINNMALSLCDGGILEGITPHYLSRHAYNDYQHKHYFNCQTFLCPAFKDFKVVSLEVWYCFDKILKFKMPKLFVTLHERIIPGLLPPTHIHFKLKRLPG